MPAPRVRVLTAAALAAGLLSLAGLTAAESSEKEAAQYAKVLKTSKDPKARATALHELGKLAQVKKSLVEPAVPDIMAALDDKDAVVRGAAARAVGMIDPDPKQVVPVLIKMLKDDKSDEARIGAAYGLASLGPAAQAARKDLQAIRMEEMSAKDKKRTKLGMAAQNALREINTKKAE